MYPFGAHVAVVEVDRETGRVRLRDYVSVDDCGVRISPTLVAGQVHGGLAQGIAQSLVLPPISVLARPLDNPGLNAWLERMTGTVDSDVAWQLWIANRIHAGA